MGKRFRVVQLAGDLNTETFTLIAPPFHCNGVLISNRLGSTALRLRTDVDDPTSELVIGVGYEQAVATPWEQAGSRFRAEHAAFALKPDAGTGEGMYLIWT